MRFKIGNMIGLICFIGFNAVASDQVTICEGDGAGGHVTLEYHEVEPDHYEALAMTYGGWNVLDNPVAIVNHFRSTIIFSGLGGIDFILNEGGRDFFVTVPAFGGHMKTTDGDCRLKDMEGKFRFEVSTLNGLPFVFSSTGPSIAFIHLYDAATGEQLSCNVDINIQRFEVIDETGSSIFSIIPSCRTNLGGVLSANFAVPRSGRFMLRAIPTSRPGHFENSVQEIVVH